MRCARSGSSLLVDRIPHSQGPAVSFWKLAITGPHMVDRVSPQPVTMVERRPEGWGWGEEEGTAKGNNGRNEDSTYLRSGAEKSRCCYLLGPGFLGGFKELFEVQASPPGDPRQSRGLSPRSSLCSELTANGFLS